MAIDFVSGSYLVALSFISGCDCRIHGDMDICNIFMSSMPHIWRFFLCVALMKFCFLSVLSLGWGAEMEHFRWEEKPQLPDKKGLSGSFVARCGDALFAAGGTNFPDKPLVEGGAKRWHDEVYALPLGVSEWQMVGRLPAPRGYGQAVSSDDGVLLIGGADAAGHYAEVWKASLDANQRAQFQPMTPLPFPLANMSAIRIRDAIYVVGGQVAPKSVEGSSALLKYSLHGAERWEVLDPLPGPPRLMPVVASDGKNLYVFSGFQMSVRADGSNEICYLRDAYVYRPDSGWQALEGLPAPAAGAPSPAALLDDGRFLVLGGVDGIGQELPVGDRPTVPRRVQIYDPQKNKWSTGEDTSFGVVCAGTAMFDGCWTVVGGEVRAGIRSPSVIALSPVREPNKSPHHGSAMR